MKVFKENSVGEDLPSYKINKKEIDQNISIVQLISKVNPEISKSEIRRLIKGNGIKIDNQVIIDDKLLVNQKLFGEKKFIKLSIGKKKHIKIEIS